MSNTSLPQVRERLHELKKRAQHENERHQSTSPDGKLYEGKVVAYNMALEELDAAQTTDRLTWTDEPPTEVGCYLYRASPDDKMTVAGAKMSGGRLVVSFPWHGPWIRPEELESVQRGEAQWAGPIPQPVES